ncbi:MAG: DUF4430 domain-containing protein [Defluviitaleaceae bacterium]|nr:DUF4430 domain-containing protein [Defluviitaleaceae bacterium]
MKKVRLFVLAFTMVAAFFVAALPLRAAANEITVFVTVEGFTLGHGFYVEPTAITVPEGTNAWDATVAVLENANIEFSLNDWGFLDRIYGIHPNTPPNPPYFITLELGEGANDGSLGAFDYSPYSGWMVTVNHAMSDVGAADYIVNDGDVIRWQFSVEGWGADLGLGIEQGFWAEAVYNHADKTALIRSLFASELDQETREMKLFLIIDPSTTQLAVNNALGAGEYVDIVPLDPPVITPIPIIGWDNPFTDVSEDDWFYGYVRNAFVQGLMIGTSPTTFEPDAAFTNNMWFTLLWRQAGEPAVQTTGTQWYSTALAWAISMEMDIPDVFLTRAEAARQLVQ